MWLEWLMVGMGIGSSAAAVMHRREEQRGRRLAYPLWYDLIGAIGFLGFGVGSLLGVPFFTGNARFCLLLLIPVAVKKWRCMLSSRRTGRSANG